MAGPERPPPPRGQGRLNRWGAGLQPLQLDTPIPWLYDFLLLLRRPGGSASLRAGWGLGPSALGCLPHSFPVPPLSHVLAVQWCIFLLPDVGHVPQGT